jgi:methylglyoxal synthase
LKEFHFLFEGGAFNGVVLGKTHPDALQTEPLHTMTEDVREFLLRECGVTVLPDRKNCGVTILANTIVERQCSIVWSFLSPVTTHWLSPEYRALNRLSDLWDVKRLVNAGSVTDWFRNEAARDAKRNPQKAPKSPLKLRLGSRERDGAWPVAARRSGNVYDEVNIPTRARDAAFYARFEDQTIALIAHDEMKQRMIDFAIQYEDELLGSIVS